MFWIPVKSTSKIFCRRVRNLGLNLVYTKNQLISWSDGKSNHHGTDTIVIGRLGMSSILRHLESNHQHFRKNVIDN